MQRSLTCILQVSSSKNKCFFNTKHKTYFGLWSCINPIINWVYIVGGKFKGEFKIQSFGDSFFSNKGNKTLFLRVMIIYCTVYFGVTQLRVYGALLVLCQRLNPEQLCANQTSCLLYYVSGILDFLTQLAWSKLITG